MTIKSSLLILSLSSSALWIPVAYAEATVAQPNRQQAVTLNIENMTCAMCTCTVTIKKALQKVDGVQQVTVDYYSKTAVVTFDSIKADSAALIKATTDTGYPGTLATSVSR